MFPNRGGVLKSELIRLHLEESLTAKEDQCLVNTSIEIEQGYTPVVTENGRNFQLFPRYLVNHLNVKVMTHLLND